MKQIKKYRKKHLPLAYLLIAALLIFLLTLLQNYAGKRLLKTEAAIGTALISIQPSSSTLPPARTYQVWLNSSQSVGFIRVSIRFDQTKIRLSQNPSLAIPNFNQVMVSPMSEANSTGTILMVAGLDPSKTSLAPSGTFQFATLPFTVFTPQQNTSSTININLVDSQVIDMNTTAFSVSAQNGTVNLNSAATPTPGGPTLTRTPTPTATNKPGDANGDGMVNSIDLWTLVIHYGQSTNNGVTDGDFNLNGVVDIFDLEILAANYGR